MKTTIELSDLLMKKAKLKAVEEGISLKDLFTRSLEKELGMQNESKKFPWEALRGKGNADLLSPQDSGFDGETLPGDDMVFFVNEGE